MHRGHQHLIAAVVARARDANAQAVVVTFYPHPVSVHRPDSGIVHLQSLPERLEVLENLGVDAVLVVPYTLEFSRLTPEEFVRQYMVDALHASQVVVGQDVRFGADNSGDLATLCELGDQMGFKVIALDDQGDPEEVTRWSSSSVREALADGDVAQAARILGRYHRVRGTVVHGDARGRTLGFPTANLGGEVTGLVPADGVYAGFFIRCDLPKDDKDRLLPAAVSIGTNPTFDGVERRVEAYVPGRLDLDLYGESVAVDCVARLRHTLAFGSTAALVTQMHDDAAAAMRILATAPHPRGE
jgi:riboflavin kinase/FMN adenylyltransferase